MSAKEMLTIDNVTTAKVIAALQYLAGIADYGLEDEDDSNLPYWGKESKELIESLRGLVPTGQTDTKVPTKRGGVSNE